MLLHDELLSNGRNLPAVAGAVEWYSWRETTLVATGWERTAEGAREKGRVTWRNCSPAGSGWTLPARRGRQVELTGAAPELRDRCYGPLPFFKGPLVVLSAPVVRWLNASALVERDIRQAQELAAGRAQAYKGPGSGRIPQDVSLGFWLSRLPRLRLVEIQAFTAWADKWKFVGDMRRLLIAHRVPWERMAWLTESTHHLWTANGATAHGRLSCAEPVCDPGLCASADDQVACRMEVVLPITRGAPDCGCYACNCWISDDGDGGSKRWSNGTCRFLRTSIPRLPTDCAARVGVL